MHSQVVVSQAIGIAPRIVLLELTVENSGLTCIVSRMNCGIAADVPLGLFFSCRRRLLQQRSMCMLIHLEFKDGHASSSVSAFVRSTGRGEGLWVLLKHFSYALLHRGKGIEDVWASICDVYLVSIISLIVLEYLVSSRPHSTVRNSDELVWLPRR